MKKDILKQIQIYNDLKDILYERAEVFIDATVGRGGDIDTIHDVYREGDNIVIQGYDYMDWCNTVSLYIPIEEFVAEPVGVLYKQRRLEEKLKREEKDRNNELKEYRRLQAKFGDIK